MLAALALVLAFEGTAVAQELRLADQDEHASIDTERDAAHALYLMAPLASLGGGAMIASGALMAMTCLTRGVPGSPPSYECTTTQPALLITGIVVAGLGSLMFMPAVVLDVRSGRRRRRLDEAQITLRLGPASFVLSGLL